MLEEGKGATKMAAFLQEPLQDGTRLIQVSLYADAWCCVDKRKVLEQFLLLLEYIRMSWVGFCPCWSSKNSHWKRAFSWPVAQPQISRVTIATVQVVGEDGGRRGFYSFFHWKFPVRSVKDWESEYGLENQNSISAEVRHHLCRQTTVFYLKICQWMLDPLTKSFTLLCASVPSLENGEASPPHRKEL